MPGTELVLYEGVIPFPAELKLCQDAIAEIGEHGAHLWWYRCLARAGVVDRGVTAGQRMHKARHSAGQRILDATGNLKAAQVVLGHATLSTTGDNYVGWDDHQAEESLRRAIPGLSS